MKKENGITLIALIITIIVMLILVGVSVTVALNGGLFNTAEEAKGRTHNAVIAEQKLDSGTIEIDGKLYASYDDYIKGVEYVDESDKLLILLRTDSEEEARYILGRNCLR